MLTYQYENLFRRTPRSCNDCKLIKSCYFQRIRLQRDKIACSDGQFGFKQLEVTEFNARWVLFQIGRQVSLSKLTAETILDEYLANWQMPDSLKYDMIDKPSWSECHVYKIAMIAFIKFLEQKDREFIPVSKSSELAAEVKAFVDTIINTKIIATNKEIVMYSINKYLIDNVKNAVIKENYKFKTVKESKDIDEIKKEKAE